MYWFTCKEFVIKLKPPSLGQSISRPPTSTSIISFSTLNLSPFMSYLVMVQTYLPSTWFLVILLLSDARNIIRFIKFYNDIVTVYKTGIYNNFVLKYINTGFLRYHLDSTFFLICWKVKDKEYLHKKFALKITQLNL